MASHFQILVSKLIDYRELVAEIYIDEHLIARLTQEAGPSQAVLELALDTDEQWANVELATFEAALQEAKLRLWELSRGRSYTAN